MPCISGKVDCHVISYLPATLLKLPLAVIVVDPNGCDAIVDGLPHLKGTGRLGTEGISANARSTTATECNSPTSVCIFHYRDVVGFGSVCLFGRASCRIAAHV